MGNSFQKLSSPQKIQGFLKLLNNGEKLKTVIFVRKQHVELLVLSVTLSKHRNTILMGAILANFSKKHFLTDVKRVRTANVNTSLL